jgi:hypothetical protein
VNERFRSIKTLTDAGDYERRLRDAVVALNRRKVTAVTLVEAIDEAQVWSSAFEDQIPFITGLDLTTMLERAPFLLCSIAAEIGFRFEGVGTDYWNKLATALGCTISIFERGLFSDAFRRLADKFGISRPSDSTFSSHFSIISWPISNALLPLDLIGPVTRLIARAPSGALPTTVRPANFPSLRAWASAAEGARLLDWLRFEAASERVIVALLTENRSGGITARSYQRIQDAVTQSSEAFFATRSARQRAKRSKAAGSAQESLGQLTLLRDTLGTKLYVTWPAIPSDLADDAKAVARAAGWRPQLWCSGARLHSDNALGEGPFLLLIENTPGADLPAFGDAATIFGEGSDIAAALAARTVDWSETLLFDVSEDRVRGEQRTGPFTALNGIAWIACANPSASVERLLQVGEVGGYRVFEADLSNDVERAILTQEGIIAGPAKALLARHPLDAMGSSRGIVHPGRPFIIFRPGPPLDVLSVQPLQVGTRFGYSGAGDLPKIRCEPLPGPGDMPVSLSLLERDNAFAALIESRLQVRIESSHSLKSIPVTVELDIGGKLLARGTSFVDEVPCTLDAKSEIMRLLYSDQIKNLLLERGAAKLSFSIKRLTKIDVQLSKPVGVVDWSSIPPAVSSGENAELVTTSASSPHKFSGASQIVPPHRGVAGYALRLRDGRLADPMRLLASSSFGLGDFDANFTNDLGSRRMIDDGRGNLDLARARVAWARADCDSLQALAAKSRVVMQFEGPLIHNLCGHEWFEEERIVHLSISDPHEALYFSALRRHLAALPEVANPHFAHEFAKAFAVRARQFDPDWPTNRTVPIGGAMDDALNEGFADAVCDLQAKGQLVGIDPDDCDFGNPEETWIAVAADALLQIRRANLAFLIAPTAGGIQLRDRFYGGTDIAEMAEDLAAWTRKFSLTRGQLTPETAAGALQLWLSPAACNSVDATIRPLVNDPFVARATRYAAIRMNTAKWGGAL